MKRAIKPIAFRPPRNGTKWVLAAVISAVAVAVLLTFLAGARPVQKAESRHGDAIVEQLMQTALPGYSGKEDMANENVPSVLPATASKA